MNGGKREDMDGIGAGDIGALIKLKDTHTGNTLCSKNVHLEIPPVEFPHPLGARRHPARAQPHPAAPPHRLRGPPRAAPPPPPAAPVAGTRRCPPAPTGVR